MLIVALATCYIIVSGRRLETYHHLEQNDFVLEYGVQGIVEDRLKKFDNRYTYSIIGGVFLCICGVLPLIITGCLGCSDIVIGFMLALMFLAIAVAVFLFCYSGSIRSAYLLLLQKEDYTPDRKEASRRNEPIRKIYWLIVVAGYLGYSFATTDWERSWIVWPVAAILFGVVATIAELTHKN